MKEGDCENGSTRKGTLGDLCGKVHHPSVPEIHIVIIKQELFKKILLGINQAGLLMGDDINLGLS